MTVRDIEQYKDWTEAMSTLGIVQLLFAAMAVVMFGLGLSLDLTDFRRVLLNKTAVALGLGLQTLVMPLVAVGISAALDLSAPYAVGMILLAAAPGSISSSLYSHVFGGNVALSMLLTAINTLTSIVTLPLYCGWALSHFTGIAGVSPSVTSDLGQSMLTLIVPAAAGMLARYKWPALATRAERPMRLLSLFVLIAFSAGAIVKEWSSLASGFAQVGFAVAAFNVISLLGAFCAGCLVSRSASTGLGIGFFVGVRSAVLAIYVALTTLNSSEIALPAAVYSITMVLFAMAFGTLMKSRAAGPGKDHLAPSPVFN